MEPNDDVVDEESRSLLKISDKCKTNQKGIRKKFRAQTDNVHFGMSVLCMSRLGHAHAAVKQWTHWFFDERELHRQWSLSSKQRCRCCWLSVIRVWFNCSIFLSQVTSWVSFFTGISIRSGMKVHRACCYMPEAVIITFITILTVINDSCSCLEECEVECYRVRETKVLVNEHDSYLFGSTSLEWESHLKVLGSIAIEFAGTWSIVVRVCDSTKRSWKVDLDNHFSRLTGQICCKCKM